MLAEEKKTTLVTAAIALFSEKPFDEITLEDITGSLGLKELLKLKYEEALPEDIDPDLIAYMYATTITFTLYNLQLYFCEMGLNKLEDVELCAKMVKTFYHGFFRHGIIKGTGAE